MFQRVAKFMRHCSKNTWGKQNLHPPSFRIWVPKIKTAAATRVRIHLLRINTVYQLRFQFNSLETTIGQGKLSGEPHDILDQLGASRLVVMLLTKVDKVPDVLQQSINLGISLLSGETEEVQKSFYLHLSSCSKSHIFMKVWQRELKPCEITKVISSREINKFHYYYAFRFSTTFLERSGKTWEPLPKLR